MNQRFIAAVGANLPLNGVDPADTVASALRDLAACEPGSLRVSSLYRTPAFPAGSGPDFVNAAFAFDSELSPTDALRLFHEIEALHGRERHARWAGRTLDLDLIGVGEQVLPDLKTWCHWRDIGPAEQQSLTPAELILPHPRLQDRAFVLIPLREIAADWRHPATGHSVAEMCTALPREEADSVVRLADPPCL